MSDFKKKQEEVKQTREEQCGKCVLCGQIRELSKTKQNDFYEAMLDKEITVSTIVEVLRSWGLKTSITTVTMHRSTGKKGQAQHMFVLKKHLAHV